MNIDVDFDILAAMPGRQADIRRITGFGNRLVSTHVRRLKDDGACYIGGWHDPHFGKLRAIYHAGEGVDVAYPTTRPKLTHLEKQRRWSAKARQTGSWAIQLEKRKQSYRRRKEQAAERAAQEAARQAQVFAPLFATPTRQYF